jgi:lactate permease
MNALLAAAPIGLVVLAMVVLRWGAAGAGLLGLGATLVIAVAGFGLGTRVHGALGPAAAGGAFFRSCVHRRRHLVDYLSSALHL